MSRVWQVSELIHQINLDFFRYGEIAVEGEVSNFTRSTAGHLYFSIKDARAQMRVVLFETKARLLRFRIENGLKLIVRGKLNLYEPKGEFQLNAVAAEPAGIGALQLALEQLKKKLAEEGLFDAARKKPIPMLPQRIAVVTSPAGAAIRDILNVLGRRFEGLAVQIYPVRVQGTTAAREIAAALGHLSRWEMHDVVLICRGGGSLEDLWPFNEEIVARAIAGCPIPTISGVGHETDFTIADLVADLRAPTPSAAAEIVIRAKSDICNQVDHAASRIRNIVVSRVKNCRHELRHLTSSDRLMNFPIRIAVRRERLERRRTALYRMLEQRAKAIRRRLAEATAPLERFPARLALRDRRRYVELMRGRIGAAMSARLGRERHRLESTMATLQAVSPLSVLARGYAIAFSRVKNRRKPVMDSMAVHVGEQIEVQLKKGALNCTVDARTMGIETVWPVVKDEG